MGDATLAINSAVCLGEWNARANNVGGPELAKRKKIVKHFVPHYPITFYGFQRIVLVIRLIYLVCLSTLAPPLIAGNFVFPRLTRVIEPMCVNQRRLICHGE